MDEFKHAANVHLDAVEHANKIVFLHKVEEGAAHMSYGIQVAQLAGIPKSVVAAAKRKLTQLENNRLALNHNQPDMFAAKAEASQVILHPVVAELEAVQPDDLTPKQALELLYKLKNLVN